MCITKKPVLNEHATKHNCLLTSPPNYKWGIPNFVRFYQNNLEVHQ